MTNEQMERLAALRKQFSIRPLGSKLTEAERADLQYLSQLEQTEDRLRFGSDYDWMKELLYKHDPIQLASMGVPEDEYENEGRMILRNLLTLRPLNVNTIRQMVWEVFEQQFSVRAEDHYHSEAGKPSDPVYQAIAEEIYKQKCA